MQNIIYLPLQLLDLTTKRHRSIDVSHESVTYDPQYASHSWRSPFINILYSLPITRQSSNFFFSFHYTSNYKKITVLATVIPTTWSLATLFLNEHLFVSNPRKVPRINLMNVTVLIFLQFLSQLCLFLYYEKTNRHTLKYSQTVMFLSLKTYGPLIPVKCKKSIDTFRRFSR